MPPWLLPAALGAADLLGGLWAGHRGEKGQEKTNEQNIALAREQMSFQERMAHSAEDFSERMSNTAMQRKTADLRAAGLNPALAYESGGASSPAGVTAGGSQARVENVTASGQQAQALRQNIMATATAMANQTKQTTADVAAKNAATAVSAAQRKQIEQDIDFARINQPHQTRALELQNMISGLGITGLENDQELEEKLKKLPGGSTKTIINIIKSFFRPK